MISPQTKLKASLLKLQKKQARFYFDISERFRENSLVCDKWRAIGTGLERQVEVLKELPLSFWKALDRREARSLLKAVEAALDSDRAGILEQDPLRQCFVKCLDFEEPVILEIYAPILRNLKAHWTDRALDWYVLVRSHLTRLIQLIEPFCGDPALVHRCALLGDRFEQALQQPPVQAEAKQGSVRALRKARKSARRAPAGAAGARKRAGASKTVVRREALRPGQHRIPKSPKPLIGKVRLRRHPV